MQCPKSFSKKFPSSGRYLRNCFQLLGNNTRKLRKLFLDDPIFLPSNHNPMYVQIVHSWFLYKYLVLKLLLMFKIKQFKFFLAKIDLRVTIPGSWSISGYFYPEKNLILWISLRKQKYFGKIFVMLIWGLGTIDS